MSSLGKDGAYGAMRFAGTRPPAVIVLVAAVLSVGCSSASSQHLTRRASYDAYLQAYVNCNYKAAHLVASQPGEVSALAVAARDRCAQEGKILNLAVQAYYANPILAWDVFNRFKNGVIEMNTDWIGQHRARQPVKRTTAPRSRP